MTNQQNAMARAREITIESLVKEISARVKSGECECEIKNPSGRCCLGEVNKELMLAKKKGSKVQKSP